MGPDTGLRCLQNLSCIIGYELLGNLLERAPTTKAAYSGAER
jgi:hypothetical protein